jgi:hypothetical protein
MNTHSNRHPVGLGDPQFTNFDRYYRSIRIFRQPMPPGSNLETVMLEAYRWRRRAFE